MTVVTFNVDQYPYCKGDTVNLSDDQRKAVDAEAKSRGVKDTYTVGKGAADNAAPTETEVSDEPTTTNTPKETEAEVKDDATAKGKGGKK